MLYSGLVLLVLAISALVLGFFGVVRGAAHLSSAMLLVSIVLIAAGSAITHRQHHRHAHR